MDSTQRLESMSVEARRDAVLKDLKSKKKDRFRDIPPHKLAELLGVPDAEHPGDNWSFLRYYEKRSLREYGWTFGLCYDFELTCWSNPEDQARLRAAYERADKRAREDFTFLSEGEREILLEWCAEQERENVRSNGMCCLAHFTLDDDSDGLLRFEAEVEDDGDCYHLLTPYDYRAGRFVDLSNCDVDEW